MFLPILLSLKIYMEWWWWCSVMSDCFVTPWTVVHHASLSMGISQARILDQVAISFSRGSSRPLDWTLVSCTTGRFFTTEPPGKPIYADIYNKVHSRVDIHRWQVFFLSFVLSTLFFFFSLHFLKVFMSNKFSQNKERYSIKEDLKKIPWVVIKIILLRQSMGIFLPLYFSIVYKVAHLSDLGLAFIMSSWLFIVLFARMGPTDTLSPGSMFHPYCDIYQLLMWLLKLSSFPARQSPLWEQRSCLSLFTAKVSYSNTTQ